MKTKLITYIVLGLLATLAIRSWYSVCIGDVESLIPAIVFSCLTLIGFTIRKSLFT